ncbi:MAG: hypothetical protein KGK07_13425 [Chloroflexota bacterium]|nr:hypothetical protein [Chloroflexota bacterium]
MREFVAIDGEGVTREDGSHVYTLLAASDGSYIEDWSRGLDTAHCLEYLLGLQARHRDATIIIYGGGYDQQMWLRDVDDAGFAALAQERWLDVRVPGRTYRVQSLFRHTFYAAHGHYDDARRRRVRDRYVRVWDVIGWFQSTFADAVEHWGVRDAAWLAELRRMKDARPEFDAAARARIRDYCLAECRALVDLMGRVAGTLDELGIAPRRWDGAGAGAAALLRQHQTDRQIVRPANANLRDAVMRAYFGGRVQIMGAGVVDGPSYTADLHGAYAREVIGLPSLAGSWKYQSYVYGGAPSCDQLHPHSLYQVRWSCPDGQRLTPLPYRQDGEILWPLMGEGWYWGVELRAAMRAVPAAYSIRAAWIYTPDDYPVPALTLPLGWLQRYWNQRMAWKRAGDPRERPLKLILAAIYGKFVQGNRQCQSRSCKRHAGEAYRPSKRGDRCGERVPAYQSYIWGGLVTAGVRARVVEAAAAAGDDLVAIATDSIIARVPLMLPDSTGRWKYGEIEPGLLCCQPGVMLSPGQQYLRLRGYRGEVDYQELADAWCAGQFAGVLHVRQRYFISARWAHRLGDRGYWRTWQDIPRELSFAPRGYPRADYYAWPRRYGDWEPILPYAAPAGVWGLSEPYQPRAQDIMESEETALQHLVEDQPDEAIETGVI